MSILLSFAHVRLSAALYPEYGVISQYEGRLLFDMMKISYEDMTCWYYVIELVLALYPVGQAPPAFATLGSAQDDPFEISDFGCWHSRVFL